MLGEGNGAILECSAGSGGLVGWIRQTMRGGQTLYAIDDAGTQYVGQGKCKPSWSSRSRKVKKKTRRIGRKGGNLGRIVVVVNIVDGVGGGRLELGLEWKWNVGSPSLGLDGCTRTKRREKGRVAQKVMD